MARTWAEVLGRERIGVYDDFFDLGGHSLLTTQVTSRLRDAFQIDLPLRQFFETPNVAGLAEAVAQRRLNREGPARVARLLEALEHMSDEGALSLLEASGAVPP